MTTKLPTLVKQKSPSLQSGRDADVRSAVKDLIEKTRDFNAERARNDPDDTLRAEFLYD